MEIFQDLFSTGYKDMGLLLYSYDVIGQWWFFHLMSRKGIMVMKRRHLKMADDLAIISIWLQWLSIICHLLPSLKDDTGWYYAPPNLSRVVKEFLNERFP